MDAGAACSTHPELVLGEAHREVQPHLPRHREPGEESGESRKLLRPIKSQRLAWEGSPRAVHVRRATRAGGVVSPYYNQFNSFWKIAP